MRTFFLISGLGLGEAERKAVRLSRELARRGHAVCIYVLRTYIQRVEELAGSRFELVNDVQLGLVLDGMWSGCE